MEEKSRPVLAPDEHPPLAERVAAAIGDPELARDVRVTLQIDGGSHEQSYRLDFEASGGRGIRCELDCRLSDRSGHVEAERVDVEAFAGLLRRIRSSGVLTLPAEEAGFLPDTVVGRLEVTDGSTVVRHYFAADPDQAEVQDRRPPAALRRAVEAIYDEGARALGMKSVAP